MATAPDGAETEEAQDMGVFTADMLDASPVSRRQLEDLTGKDPIMQSLQDTISRG